MKKTYKTPMLTDCGSAIAQTLEALVSGIEPETGHPDMNGTL